ncbi:MAG: hypothetical protein ACI4M9_01290, partial [Succinivibrio sp.]
MKLILRKFYKSRNLSLTLAVTNIALGCGLGFFYGSFSITSCVTALSVLVAGVFLLVLCNYSIDYSRAYLQHKKDSLNGIVAPIVIHKIPLTALRKRMAVITIVIAVFGFIASHNALGYSVQQLSWFLFLCVIGVLSTLLYTSSSLYFYKGIGAMVLFSLFGFFSIFVPQFLVIASCHQGIDIYPDTYFLSFSAATTSLIVLYVRNVQAKTLVRKYYGKSLRQLFGYEFSSFYLVALFVTAVLTSMLACMTSHRLTQSVFLLAGYLPMT